jgi:hypothetical protein
MQATSADGGIVEVFWEFFGQPSPAGKYTVTQNGTDQPTMRVQPWVSEAMRSYYEYDAYDCVTPAAKLAVQDNPWRGTFQFTACNRPNPTTIEVTDGQFNCGAPGDAGTNCVEPQPRPSPGLDHDVFRPELRRGGASHGARSPASRCSKPMRAIPILLLRSCRWIPS